MKLLRLRGDFVAGRAQFGYLQDTAPGSTGILDEVVATFFAGPKSYTGEDVLEIATHGAPVVLEAVVQGAVRFGARLAEPGEFTQRAFLSGRLDLTQAEAVHDLVRATTLHQARVAASQMGGALSKVVQPIKTELIALIATLEAGIDFAEDDLEVQSDALTVSRLSTLFAALTRLEQSYRYGSALREGTTLTIIGRPNAGKSSLFNVLLGKNRAIVTAIPGTTRDAIVEQMSFAGIPVQITDTAGLRDTTDEIEALGIARSHEMLAEAALVLLVVDGTRELDAADRAMLGELCERPTLVALNKSDLSKDDELEKLEGHLGQYLPRSSVVRVSAYTQDGLQTLRAAIHKELVGETALMDQAFLTNERQHTAVQTAQIGLTAALAALGRDTPHEMVLLDLHETLDALDSLTGTTTTDDVLTYIFSTFCIGK